MLEGESDIWQITCVDVRDDTSWSDPGAGMCASLALSCCGTPGPCIGRNGVHQDGSAENVFMTISDAKAVTRPRAGLGKADLLLHHSLMMPC